MKQPNVDPEGWSMTAIAEAEDNARVARISLWVVAVVFGIGIAASAYFALPTGWVVLIAFLGLATIIAVSVLPSLQRLDAGRAYIEQAETVAYSHRIGLER